MPQCVFACSCIILIPLLWLSLSHMDGASIAGQSWSQPGLETTAHMSVRDVRWSCRYNQSGAFTHMGVLWISCCLNITSVPSIYRNHFSFTVFNETFSSTTISNSSIFSLQEHLYWSSIFFYYIQSYTHTRIHTVCADCRFLYFCLFVLCCV